MHEVFVKGILTTKNKHSTMNLYRGCTHGCIYCDSRSKCYQMEHEFTDVAVKINAITLLELTLKKKKEKSMLAMGSMSDPYLHLEASIGLTRKALEVIYKYGFGVSLITKSNLILKDLDILKKINEKSRAVVQMTLTTYDEFLCKTIEPNVSSTKERVEALKILASNNIDTYVWLCPILPYINDDEKNLLGILNYCKEAKVKGIVCFGFGMTLREGNREYYYENLDKYFPGIKDKYIKRYKNYYSIQSPNNTTLYTILKKFCQENNILYKSDEVFKDIENFVDRTQITLF